MLSPDRLLSRPSEGDKSSQARLPLSTLAKTYNKPTLRLGLVHLAFRWLLCSAPPPHPYRGWWGWSKASAPLGPRRSRAGNAREFVPSPQLATDATASANTQSPGPHRSQIVALHHIHQAVAWYLNKAIFLVSEDDEGVQGFACANPQTGLRLGAFRNRRRTRARAWNRVARRSDRAAAPSRTPASVSDDWPGDKGVRVLPLPGLASDRRRYEGRRGLPASAVGKARQMACSAHAVLELICVTPFA